MCPIPKYCMFVCGHWVVNNTTVWSLCVYIKCNRDGLSDFFEFYWVLLIFFMALKMPVIVFKYEYIMNVNILQSSICNLSTVKLQSMIDVYIVYYSHTQSDFNIIIPIKHVKNIELSRLFITYFNVYRYS